MVVKLDTVESAFESVQFGEDSGKAELRSIDIEIIRDRGGFEMLSETWNDLLQSSSSNVVFLTHEWLSVWIRNYSDAVGGLRIIVARRGSEIVGIAPLMVTRREGFRRLGSIGVESLDYEDIIVRQGADSSAVVGAVVDAVLSEKGWDYWQFNRIGRSREVIASLGDALRETHCDWVMAESEFSSIVPVDGGWDDYWRSLSRRFRKNFRRHSNRLAEAYDSVEIGEAKSVSDITAGLECLFRFHRARRREISGNEGLFSSHSRRGYYRELATEMMTAGWLRMPTIKIDGRLVGVQFNIEYGDTIYKVLPGFDAEFADFAVGMQLNVDVMKGAFDRQIRQVDFLRGDEGYKSDFRPTRLQLYSLSIFRNSTRGHMANRWTRHVRPFVRQCFDIRRIKKVLNR